MQSVIGDEFISRNGPVSFSDIENIEIIALYFTASWCPPCRIFTPTLVEFYNDINYPDKRMEVIHISSDKDEASFTEYFSHVPWIAIPYGDARLKALKTRFRVTGIPILVILNRDGTIAHGTARADVQQEGPQCFERWLTLRN